MSIVVGLLLGSFLNVCIYRIPRRESIVYPPSHCPCCNARLRWFELIPVISFLLLRGRCRHCSSRISWRYPAVELLTGLLFYLVYLNHLEWSLALVRDWLLVAFLMVVSFIDLEHLRIPDVLTLGSFAVFALWQLLLPWQSHSSAALGAVVGWGLLFAIAVVSRGGMGGGDIKLAAVLGLYLGFPGILLALGLAFILGAAVGLLLVISGVKGRKDPIPFGPFLAFGSLVVILWGENILRWYLRGFAL